MNEFSARRSQIESVLGNLTALVHVCVVSASIAHPITLYTDIDTYSLSISQQRAAERLGDRSRGSTTFAKPV